MPLLSHEMKLTIKSRLWDGQTVTFDEDEKGFSINVSEGAVDVDQFLNLCELGVGYVLDRVSVSDGSARVHFTLID